MNMGYSDNITKFEQEAFNAGAHQAMQETRFEIALNLIKLLLKRVIQAFVLNLQVMD